MRHGGLANVGWFVLIAGCSSEDHRAPPADDEAAATSSVQPVSTGPGEAPSSDAGPGSRSDAGGDQNATRSGSGLDAGKAPTMAMSHELDAGTGATAAPQQDASLVEQPTELEVTVEMLCSQIGELEGRVVVVELSSRLTVGNWVDVGTDQPADAATDGGFCGTRLAPYVLPCDGHVLIVSAPSEAFGVGPEVGGEELTFGCWEAACEAGCVPETAMGVGKVRSRVNGPIDGRLDEVSDQYVGQVRLNGVDFEALGVLEILERR